MNRLREKNMARKSKAEAAAQQDTGEQNGKPLDPRLDPNFIHEVPLEQIRPAPSTAGISTSRAWGMCCTAKAADMRSATLPGANPRLFAKGWWRRFDG